jgi:hypothetical protein
MSTYLGWAGALAGSGLAIAAVFAGAAIEQSPVASAQDGGVCARLNGVPFYIPPQGYGPKPGEVITGPVTAGPCKESAGPGTSQPSLPNLPSVPTSSTTSTTPPPAPPAP